MSATPPLELPKSDRVSMSQPPTVEALDVRELLSFAVEGLVPMLDADKQLFCHRLLNTERGLVREGISQRYTIMTLLGLRELELAGINSPFDLGAIYKSLVHSRDWIHGVGDLGLLLWLTAAFDPDSLGTVFHKFHCEAALDRYPDARQSRTMELSWFLAGLAHAAEASPVLADPLTDLSVETYHLIEANQGEYGLFGHMSQKASIAGRLRGRIGSFADQVYPIYALSRFASTFHVEDPLGPASECATAICGAQGESGQWWWLYDQRTGRVSSRYPVYSVHQHGMAPMSLFAVEEATGQCFRDFIYKGLSWIYGYNEMSMDMRDAAQHLVWRCITPAGKRSKYLEIVLSLMRQPAEDKQPRSLTVLHEQRPYEFGWLLFAFGRRANLGSSL